MTNTTIDLGELAYGLLLSMIYLVETAPDCAQRERVLCTMEAEILKVADHLLESHAIKGDFERLLLEVIRTGSEALMRRSIEQDPEHAAHALNRITQSGINQNLSAAQSGLLIYLAETHEGRPFRLGSLIAEAARRGDKDLFFKIAAPFHPLEPFWSLEAVEAIHAVDACGIELAPELARRLRAAQIKDSKTCKGLQEGYYMYHELKALSVFLSAGFNMSQTEDFDSERLPDNLRALLKQSASSHGRLALMAKEEPLEDVLARPSKDGVFFGFQRSKKGLLQIDATT
jgi:hypothetical protein